MPEARPPILNDDGTPDRSARAEDLAHWLGHDCTCCRAIRRLGPAEPQNPLARLIAPAVVTEATPADARACRYVRAQLRKRARRTLAERGYPGLLNAIRKAA